MSVGTIFATAICAGIGAGVAYATGFTVGSTGACKRKCGSVEAAAILIQFTEQGKLASTSNQQHSSECTA